ncbi:Natterin-2 [Holothuria leucospilota]|uniref:Natterin-2 n=1 Tax=Holothuria leucospilota TaxID=206669 RepID=A0A9Q1GVD4_HOLLE|nr:Natterin-2 [Holothuria leucospilota]
MLLIATVVLVGWFGRVSSQAWSPAGRGSIPAYAFSGETFDEDGNALFVCKGWVENTVACGKTSQRLGNCRIPFNHREHILPDNYWVLIQPPWAEYTLEWTDGTYSNGEVPSDAVSAANGVYVGRYRYRNYYLLGKVVPGRNNFFYGYNGNEKYETSGYEVLVMKPRRVDHYKLLDVVYDLSQASQTISPDNVILARKDVQHKSPSDVTTTLSMQITLSTTIQWSQMNNFEIHPELTMTVSAGIPGIVNASAGWSIGASATRSYTYGDSYTTSETNDHEVEVRLQADSNVTVWIIGKEANVKVPYRASVTKVFSGYHPYTRENVPGVYTNVHIASFESVINSVPLDSEATETFSFWSILLLLTFQLTLFMLM